MSPIKHPPAPLLLSKNTLPLRWPPLGRSLTSRSTGHIQETLLRVHIAQGREAEKGLLLGHLLYASFSRSHPRLLPRRDDTEIPGASMLYELDPGPRCTMQTPSPGPSSPQQWASWSAQGSAPSAGICRKMGSGYTEEGSVVAEWTSEGGWHPSRLECWDIGPYGTPGAAGGGAVSRVRPQPPERGSSRITRAQLSHKHGLGSRKE